MRTEREERQETKTVTGWITGGQTPEQNLKLLHGNGPKAAHHDTIIFYIFVIISGYWLGYSLYLSESVDWYLPVLKYAKILSSCTEGTIRQNLNILFSHSSI